jgi:phage terminase small subunit
MPKRTPRHVKIMRGTLRPGREPAEPATPQAGKARPPKWLPPAERAAFRQLAVEIERTGVPSRSFAHVLATAACAWVQLERYSAVLSEKGDVYETSTTTGALKIMPRPEVHLRNAALRLLRGYLGDLGLTPLSIGRVDRKAVPPAESPLEEQLFGARQARVERFFGGAR